MQKVSMFKVLCPDLFTEQGLDGPGLSNSFSSPLGVRL